MTVAGFQIESESVAKNTDNRLKSSHSFSDQTLAATLESILIGFLIRKNLTAYDLEILNHQFVGRDRLMIVCDNKCLYPVGDDKGECSICTIIKEDCLNLCDLQNNHPNLVDSIEYNWPALLDALSKVRNAFETNNAVMLVNRSSGRVLSANKSFSVMTGISLSEIEDKEFTKIFARISSIIGKKKLSLTNFDAGDTPLCLVTLNTTAGPGGKSEVSKTASVQKIMHTHQIIEETDTLGLHLNRFNTLLQRGTEMAIEAATASKLESVVSESSRNLLPIDTNINRAIFRLSLQSLVTTHNSIAGESARTKICLKHKNQNISAIEIETTVTSKQHVNIKENLWFQTALDLAEKIGLSIKDPKFTKKKILTTICRRQKKT